MMFPIARAALVAAIGALASAPMLAQGLPSGGDRCAAPDTLLVRGAVRTSAASILTLSGLTAGTRLTAGTEVQRAIQAIFASGDYDDVRASCDLLDNGKAALVFDVRERPLLRDISVVGAKAQTQRAVEDRVELLIGRPVDPALVTRGMARIDSLYQSTGYYLARITADTTVIDSTHITLKLRIDEGPRMAISGLIVNGNTRVSSKEIAVSMKTRPEGFLWFRKGTFDDEKYAGDLGERIPALFASYGFLDFQILHDTVMVDRTRGKGVIVAVLDTGIAYEDRARLGSVPTIPPLPPGRGSRRRARGRVEKRTPSPAPSLARVSRRARARRTGRAGRLRSSPGRWARRCPPPARLRSHTLR